MRVSRAILGIKVETSGLERFDPNKPYVFMANHVSFLDGPLLFVVIPGSVRVILKKSVFAFPVLGWIMITSGFVSVDRRAGGGGVRSIERAVRAMKEKGYSFLIFPEGTRSLDGNAQAVPEGRILPGRRGRGAHRSGDHPGDVRADAQGAVRVAARDGRRRIPPTPFRSRAMRSGIWTSL